jgi:hypothetical protein
MEKDNFMDNVAGKFSLHDETSGKGILLGHLVTMYHPVIKSTCFQHKNVKEGLGKCLEIELIKLTKTHLSQTTMLTLSDLSNEGGSSGRAM